MESHGKRVSVFGLGYIGLPTALLLANSGYTVNGIDTDSSRVEMINSGIAPFYEPHLSILLSKLALDDNRLRGFVNPQPADIYLICVPTPLIRNSHEPDLSAVYSVIDSISALLKNNDLIIIESTCPCGTSQNLVERISQSRSDITFHLAYCPERVLPGKVFEELQTVDRIIGGVTQSSSDFAACFYKSFLDCGVLTTDARTAELVKLAENSYRDLNIAFANQLSMLCESVNVNVWNLIRYANLHPRVQILEPGVGVGGHCIAVDPWFLAWRNEDLAALTMAARDLNLSKTKWVLSHIESSFKTFVRQTGISPTILCFGITFKPNVEDLRESPALFIARSLETLGYAVAIVEPNLKSHSEFDVVSVDYLESHCVLPVILVKHQEFQKKELLCSLKSMGALDYCGLLTE